MVGLDQLGVLGAVHEHGSVTAAAQALHLTPSAVSHRIRVLTRELGVPLLEPAGRGVRLTPAGLALVGHADALRARWEQARADLAAHADELGGVIRLGGFPTAVARLLSPAAVRLHQREPRLEVRIVERDTPTSLRMLLAGELDLAIVDPVEAIPTKDTRLDQRPLLNESIDLLIPHDHRLARHHSIALAELSTETWISGITGTSHHQLLLTACAEAGFTPDIRHEATDWASVWALVADQHGIALIPRLTPYDQPADLPPAHRTHRLRLHGTPQPRRRIIAALRRGSRSHPAIHAALHALEHIAQPHRTHPATS